MNIKLLDVSVNEATISLVTDYTHEMILGLFVLLIIVTIILIIFMVDLNRGRKKLWEMAYLDNLTRLPNRTRFKMDAARLLQENADKKYFILQFDINKFNIVNDLYGFKEGDRLLFSIRDAVSKNLDKDLDILARIGADRFMLLKNCETVDFQSMSDKNFMGAVFGDKIETDKYSVKFSVGRYFIKDNAISIDDIVERVNYIHNEMKKRSTHVTICDYNDDIRKVDIRQRELENMMDVALENEEYIVYLQSKHDCIRGKIVGFEALVRWQGANNLDIIMPNEFIPLFEKNGFIVQLDMYMFKKVCAIMQKWKSQNKPLVPVSINFSRLHIQNPNFVNDLLDIIKEFNIPHKFIEIELTENAMLTDEKAATKVIKDLHKVGFAVSMDDFGTGYSSLGLLKNLHFDTIKLDRSFFVDIEQKSRATAVIKNIIKMAKDLQIKTVAEGVETLEQVMVLKNLGCQAIQGFYFARPIPHYDAYLDVDAVYLDEVKTVTECNYDVFIKNEYDEIDFESTIKTSIFRMYEYSLNDVLISEFGEDEAVEIYRKRGVLSGTLFAENVLDCDMEFEEFLNSLVDKMKEFKVCNISIDKFDFESKNIYFLVADGFDYLDEHNLGKTICNYQLGFISGVLEIYTGVSYILSELDCRGKSSRYCIFKAVPKE